MKYIIFLLTAAQCASLISCSKKTENQNNGSVCYSDQFFDVPLHDTLHLNPPIPDSVRDVDSVQVVYRAVSDLSSSLSKGSRIDSIYYTGVIDDSKGVKDSIVEITVGQQPSYQNWETGVIISGAAFFRNYPNRTLHLRVRFTLFGSNSIGRSELQTTNIHNGSIGRPQYDNYDDNCKLR